MNDLRLGNHPVHPGKLLKEEVEYHKIQQRKLAEQIGMPYNVLNDILNKRRPLTANNAMLFEAALGVNAEMLMRMQTKYNMQMACEDKSFAKRLEKIRQTTMY